MIKKCVECDGKKQILWLDVGDRPVVSNCYKCKGKGYIEIERKKIK